MTKRATARLFDEVRGLPESDRIKLVEELLLDLNGPLPTYADSELQAVVDRRTAEVKAGVAELLTREQVKALKAERRAK
jgi:putative addiction module component (TIGR02574 family)